MSVAFCAYVFHGWEVSPGKVRDISISLGLRVPKDASPKENLSSVFRKLKIEEGVFDIQEVKSVFFGKCLAKIYANLVESAPIPALAEKDAEDLAKLRDSLGLPEPKMLLVGEVSS